MKMEQSVENDDLVILSERQLAFDLINRLNPESNYQFIISEIQIDDNDRSSQWELITNVEGHLKNNIDCSLIFYKSLLVAKIYKQLSELQVDLKIQMSSLQNSFVGYVIIYASKLLLKPLLNIVDQNNNSAGHNLLIKILQSKTEMIKRKKEYIEKHMAESILQKRVNKKKIQQILAMDFSDFNAFKPYFRIVINFLYTVIYKYSKFTQQKTRHYRLLLRIIYATSIHHLQYDNLHIFENLHIWLQKHGFTDIGPHLQSYLQNCNILTAKQDMSYIMNTHFAKLK